MRERGRESARKEEREWEWERKAQTLPLSQLQLKSAFCKAMTRGREDSARLWKYSKEIQDAKKRRFSNRRRCFRTSVSDKIRTDRIGQVDDCTTWSLWKNFIIRTQYILLWVVAFPRCAIGFRGTFCYCKSRPFRFWRNILCKLLQRPSLVPTNTVA